LIKSDGLPETRNFKHKTNSFMKYISIIFLAVAFAACSSGTEQKPVDTATKQPVAVDNSALLNWAAKTPANEAERKQMLDAVRADIHQKGYPEFQFVVNHLMLKDGFAFFKGDAQNADGSAYSTSGEAEDCCHVEALLKKENNTWKILAASAFSTDAWYVCLWQEFNVPKAIFDFTEACPQ
jgi:hypothetical protein